MIEEGETPYFQDTKAAEIRTLLLPTNGYNIVWR